MRTDLWEKGSAPCFGVVGPDYQPLQNSNAFEFFDKFVKNGDVTYETAGALGEGERIWILAKEVGDMRVAGVDICERSLLLSNSYDGQSSLQVKFTPIRVVCQNTLTMALNHGSDLFRNAHKRSLENRRGTAKETIGLISGQFKQIEETFQAMAQVRMNATMLKKYYQLAFPDPRDMT